MVSQSQYAFMEWPSLELTENTRARAHTPSKQASKQARHMTMHDGAKSMSTYQTIQ